MKPPPPGCSGRRHQPCTCGGHGGRAPKEQALLLGHPPPRRRPAQGAAPLGRRARAAIRQGGLTAPPGSKPPRRQAPAVVDRARPLGDQAGRAMADHRRASRGPRWAVLTGNRPSPRAHGSFGVRVRARGQLRTRTQERAVIADRRRTTLSESQGSSPKLRTRSVMVVSIPSCCSRGKGLQFPSTASAPLFFPPIEKFFLFSRDSADNVLKFCSAQW